MRNNIEVLSFENSKIRVRTDHLGSVVYLCLNDIVKYLGRKEMIERGSIFKICKSVTRLPFKEGGRNRWAIKPFEIHYLLNTISSENGMIAQKCLKLQNWLSSLPMSIPSDVHLMPPATSDDLVIFNYQDRFPITFKSDCGKTYVNATQMARSFEKYPYVWLVKAETQELREALVKSGESSSLESQVISTRGKNGVTWIEESLAMEFARWLSPEFSLWCNSKIKELVTEGYATILPKAPMRHPSATPVTFDVPKTFDEALQLAADQARRLRENEHKVSFYDEYVENRDHFRTSRIADELETSTILLHRFLAEEGIIHYERERRRWVVNAPYRPLQCDVPYLYRREDGKVYPFGSVRRWSPAGREYIIELWNNKNGDNGR